MTPLSPGKNPNRLRQVSVYAAGLGIAAFFIWFAVTDIFSTLWEYVWPTQATAQKPPDMAQPQQESDTNKKLKKGYEARTPEPAYMPAPQEAPVQVPSPTPVQDFSALEPILNKMANGINELIIQNKILIEAHKKPAQTTTTPKKETPKETEAERKARLKAAQQEYQERINKAKAWKSQSIDGEPQKESSSTVHRLKTPYALAPGTVINFATEAKVTNDTPGPFRAFVTAHVCDSATHSRIVIPQMAAFMLKVSGKSIYGDNRLPVEASTMTFPNGNYLKLSHAAVGDREGTAGFSDEINRHLLRTFGSVVLTGVLRSGSGILASSSGATAPERIGSAIASETASKGTQEARQFLRTDPTMTIRSGYEGMLYLQEELALAEPYDTGSAPLHGCGQSGPRS